MIKLGVLFTDIEAAALYEAQRILARHIDATDLSEDTQVAEAAEQGLRELINRDLRRAEMER